MMGAVLNFPRLRDTCPEDLLWQSPGTPETRRPMDAELVEVNPPQQWRATPADGGGGKLFGLPLWVCILVALVIGAEIGFIAGCYMNLIALAKVL